MTGPEHYRAAEHLLDEAGDTFRPDSGLTEKEAAAAQAAITEAQVHATLALAASFAEVNPTSAWHEVAGQSGGQS